MSLIIRQPRPLKRDAGTFRDDRLFIVACDDTYAPKQYFNFFKISRVQVHVFPSEGGLSSIADHVLDKLLSIEHEEFDELWLLLDTDHYIHGEHLKGFSNALSRARQNHVNIALSRPCFELWLLLHQVGKSDVADLDDAVSVTKKLREVLGEYNKTNLKKEHFTIDKVANAILEAQALDSKTVGGIIPANTTTRIYLLWKSIISKAALSQLPQPLADIQKQFLKS